MPTADPVLKQQRYHNQIKLEHSRRGNRRLLGHTEWPARRFLELVHQIQNKGDQSKSNLNLEAPWHRKGLELLRSQSCNNRCARSLPAWNVSKGTQPQLTGTWKPNKNKIRMKSIPWKLPRSASRWAAVLWPWDLVPALRAWHCVPVLTPCYSVAALRACDFVTVLRTCYFVAVLRTYLVLRTYHYVVVLTPSATRHYVVVLTPWYCVPALRACHCMAVLRTWDFVSALRASHQKFFEQNCPCLSQKMTKMAVYFKN